MKKLLLLCMSCLLVLVAWAQQRTVTGTVTAADDGTALPGVNVLLKGTTVGTVTDVSGSFSIQVPDAGGTLIFSFIGLVSQEIDVGGRTTVDVVMKPDVTQLSEVVVTALGITREEKSLGYSVQEVKADEFNSVKTDNFMNSLSGRVAGLHVQNNTNFGGSNNILIRGATSITGNNQPLYVVDGVPISNTNSNTSSQADGRHGYDYGNASADIDPNDIASISVLKGAAAAALYGSRAANGVILITTKKGSKAKGFGVTLNSNFTMGKVDKSTFPEYQHQYGGGYGPFYSGGDHPYLSEFDADGDGQPDLLVPYTEDASRGEKFDPSLMVYMYDAWIPESPYYHQKRAWLPAENGPITFFNTAKTYSNSVDISNANDKGSYRIGYTNYKSSGILPNSTLNKNDFILNGSFNILENLKVTSSANFVMDDATGRQSTGYSGNLLSSFRQWNEVNVDIQEQKDLYYRTHEGNATWNLNAYDDPTPIYWDNYYWDRYQNYENDNRNRLIGYTQLDWKISDAFSVMGRMAIDTYDQLEEERRAVGSVAEEFGVPFDGVQRATVTSGYSRNSQNETETNMDLMLNYHQRFGELDVTALGGSNIRRNKLEDVFASTNNGLAVPGLYALSNSVDPLLPPQESLLQRGVNGLFGSVSVGYHDLVYLDGTLRRDQSSTLPSANNAYYYPSVSTSFVFSELANANWLSLGKLRLNYAEVGNDAPPLRVKDTYRVQAPFSGNALVSTSVSKNNPDLVPEQTKSVEAGLQMNFLNNRFGIDATLYKARTFNQIQPLSVSYVTGYVSKWINAGEIDNKGAEVMVFAEPVHGSNITWRVTVNWARNRNKVVKLYEDATGNKVTNLILDGNLQGGVHIVAREGQPYGSIIGSDYVYAADGQRLVKSSGRYEISTTNDIVLGNYNPDWTGGIQNTISYKNFDFGFLIDGQHGGDVFSLDQWYGTGTGIYKESAGLNDLGNPVRDPIVINGDGSYAANSGGLLNPGEHDDGTPNTTRVAADNYAVDGWAVSPNKRFVYDASFIKLREVTLTYNLPTTLLGKSPIAGASIGFVGSNLWIIHKNLPYSDPEASQGGGNIQGWQSGVMPATKNYGFTLNVKF